MYNSSQLFLTTNNLRSTKLALQQNELALQGQLMELDYQLANQKRVYDTQKKMYEKNLTSQLDFERERDYYFYLIKKRELTLENHQQDSLFREQQVAQLEYSVDLMEKNLAIIQQQLENLTVKAPIKGQLTSLNAEIGQSISRGENLGQIDDITAYKIRAAIDEHYIARVVVGQKGTFTFDNNTYSLVIKTVYPEVSGGRFEVDLVFDGEAPSGIRRGQTVHIRLELSAPEEVLYVEMGGFYQTTGGQWIFVVEPGGKAAVRSNIRLGRSNTQFVEVLEGLKEGENVVTSSYDNYGDIEKLNIN